MNETIRLIMYALEAKINDTWHLLSYRRVDADDGEYTLIVKNHFQMEFEIIATEESISVKNLSFDDIEHTIRVDRHKSANKIMSIITSYYRSDKTLGVARLLSRIMIKKDTSRRTNKNLKVNSTFMVLGNIFRVHPDGRIDLATPGRQNKNIPVIKDNRIFSDIKFILAEVIPAIVACINRYAECQTVPGIIDFDDNIIRVLNAPLHDFSKYNNIDQNEINGEFGGDNNIRIVRRIDSMCPPVQDDGSLEAMINREFRAQIYWRLFSYESIKDVEPSEEFVKETLASIFAHVIGKVKEWEEENDKNE